MNSQGELAGGFPRYVYAEQGVIPDNVWQIIGALIVANGGIVRSAELEAIPENLFPEAETASDLLLVGSAFYKIADQHKLSREIIPRAFNSLLRLAAQQNSFQPAFGGDLPKLSIFDAEGKQFVREAGDEQRHAAIDIAGIGVRSFVEFVREVDARLTNSSDKAKKRIYAQLGRDAGPKTFDIWRMIADYAAPRLAAHDARNSAE